MNEINRSGRSVMNEPGVPVGFTTALGRALLLRCPRCGTSGILDGWFRLKTRCPVCALGLRRAPEDDEWFGGYFVNLITSELLMLAVVIGFVLWSWPAVAWNTVEVLGVVMVIVSPIVSYPFAKVLWVAVEFVFAERAGTTNRRRP
jgi:uncharacterized protein (DUF983 family)